MTAGGGIHSPIGSAALLLAWNYSVAVGHLLPPTLLDIMVAVVKQRGPATKRVCTTLPHLTAYCRLRNSFAITETISLPFSAPIYLGKCAFFGAPRANTWLYIFGLRYHVIKKGGRTTAASNFPHACPRRRGARRRCKRKGKKGKGTGRGKG